MPKQKSKPAHDITVVSLRENLAALRKEIADLAHAGKSAREEWRERLLAVVSALEPLRREHEAQLGADAVALLEQIEDQIKTWGGILERELSRGN